MSLKLYTVHAKSGLETKYHSPVFIREGFNPLAFLFTFAWALYHRLWKLAALILAFQLAIELIAPEGLFSFASLCAMQIGFNILIGFHANDWLRVRLRQRGFIFTDIVAGDSLMRAEQRYFERYTTQPSVSA